MKLIVYGAGAIGSVFGGYLSGNDVLLIAKGRHFRSIKDKGLKIVDESAGTTRVLSVNAEDHIAAEDISEDTLILLTMKAQDISDSVSSIKDIVKKDTLIVCMQNGWKIEDMAKKAIEGKCRILRAVTRVGAYLEPGIAYYTGRGTTIIEKSDRSDLIKKLFENAGFETEITDDIDKAVFKKVIINCAVNSLTALLGERNRVLLKVKNKNIMEAIVDEALKVGEKMGFVYEEDLMAEINKAVIKTATNKSSTLQDLERGKSTEIDYLNGMIVDAGNKYNIPTPVNALIVQLIKANEKGDPIGCRNRD